jgi:hypothetical protein
MTAASGSGRAAFGLATTAVICAAAFTVWALFAPAYSAGESIVEANPELVARAAVAAPLLVTSAVWMLLHVACRFDARWARRVALAVASLLVAFAWMTGFTIGMFVLPGAVALVAAAALTPVSRP